MEMNNQVKTKKCEICGRELPISEFSKSYKNRCRECVAKQTREKRTDAKCNDAGCTLLINPNTFDMKVWNIQTNFKDDDYNQWIKSIKPILSKIYDIADGKIEPSELYIFGDIINMLDCMEIKCKKGGRNG